MLRTLLDIIGEYIEAKDSHMGWLGNDRIMEMEYDFEKLLKEIIDARVREILKEKNL